MELPPENEVVLLDLSQSCRNPQRLKELVEEARDRVTDDPKGQEDNLEDLLLETESLVLKDYPLVRELARHIADRYFSPYTIKHETCGVAGASYVNQGTRNKGRRALVSGIKKPESILSKLGKKMQGKEVVYQTWEVIPAMATLASTEYALGDVLRLRSIGEKMYDVREMVDEFLKDPDLKVKENGVEYINGGNTGYYFGYHIDLVMDGLRVELQVVPKAVNFMSKIDNYHNKTKYDMDGLQRRYELREGLYLPTGLKKR